MAILNRSKYSYGLLNQAVVVIIRLVKFFLILSFAAPTDLAVFGVLSAILFFIEASSKTGVSDFLIASQDTLGTDWDTAWSFEIARGILMFIVALLVGYLTLNYFEYNEHWIVYLVMVLALPVSGFKNIYTIRLRKDLNFNKYLMYNLLPLIFGLLLLVFYYYHFSPLLAMAMGFLSNHILYLIGSYIIVSDRPRVNWDALIIKKQLRFGKWIFIQTWVDFIGERADRLILAATCSPELVGIYVMGANLTTDMQAQFKSLMRGFVFPHLARNSRNKKMLFDVIKRQTIWISIFGIIGTWLISGTGLFELITRFKSDWASVELLILPLFWLLILSILISQYEPLYLAKMKPKNYVIISTLKNLIMPFFLFSVGGFDSLQTLASILNCVTVMYAVIAVMMFVLMRFK